MAKKQKISKEKIILETASKLFLKKGYHATTMGDIATEAKIAKGLTYFYFKNKEDLYLAMTKKALDEVKDLFRVAFRDKGQTGLEMMSEVASNFIKYSLSHKTYYEAIQQYLSMLNQLSDPIAKENINPLVLESPHFLKLMDLQKDISKIGIQIIRLGIKDGSIRSELNPEATFFTVWGMMLGFERMMGAVLHASDEYKINLDIWKLAFLGLLKDMLRGTFQAQKVKPIQGSLF